MFPPPPPSGPRQQRPVYREEERRQRDNGWSGRDSGLRDNDVIRIGTSAVTTAAMVFARDGIPFVTDSVNAAPSYALYARTLISSGSIRTDNGTSKTAARVSPYTRTRLSKQRTRSRESEKSSAYSITSDAAAMVQDTRPTRSAYTYAVCAEATTPPSWEISDARVSEMARIFPEEPDDGLFLESQLLDGTRAQIFYPDLRAHNRPSV
ncbi:hypothetical protein DFH07DRAFT_785084 [Mycena maculata]|uniref:Uncharacterized protein n=1 Tax=Mycena maculata TaxID=230809 RepID=A0AAD7HDW3_9AGAR|nr:hypothetical protein DFH07DRAFT_785084 [Mycena maculata]